MENTKEQILAQISELDKQKALLSEQLKKLTSLDIKERVKTYEDACNILGKKVLTIEDFSVFEDSERSFHFASHKLKVIIESLNEGWTPDFSNKNQQKWYPWFKIHPCFELDDCGDNWYCISGTPSLFLFKNEELCRYATNQFLDIYKELIAPSNR